MWKKFVRTDIFHLFLRRELTQYLTADCLNSSSFFPNLTPADSLSTWQGPAVVVVSCVTIDNDPSPRTHPHNLVSPASVSRDTDKTRPTKVLTKHVCEIHFE